MYESGNRSVAGVRPRDAGSAKRRLIRLLLVDDSIVVRSILRRMLADQPAFEVVDAVGNVDQALAVLDREAIDIILLDVQMPGVDGLTALPSLLDRGRGARILIVSSLTSAGADTSIRAMTLGAADTLLKPSAGGFGTRFEATLVERLLKIGEALPQRGSREAESTPPERIALRRPQIGPVECLAIGASTGGLHALAALFRALGPGLNAPILVTQHLPPVFMPYFAAQLRDMAGRIAEVATEGLRIEPGRIYVAPGEAHMRLVRSGGQIRVRLDRAAVLSCCMPSVDPMLESLGDVFGPGALAVMLSGMGRDGAAGAERFVAAGGELLVQDAASSVVWGMPGAVARAGLASFVGSPEQIAARIAQRTGARAERRGDAAPWS